MEQVIGVDSAGTTYQDDEETVVVQGRVRLRPQWVATPSNRRLADAYPTRALERGWEGEASVACVVQDNGRLMCNTVSESPDNSGFGAAARRIALNYRHGPNLENGSPAPGTPVNFRVLFRIEEQNRRGPPSTWR
jgi:protein TonB